MPNNNIRRVILEIVNEFSGRDSSFQAGSVLEEAENRLIVDRNNIDLEQAILTAWYDLFRTGYLAWGYNLANPNPPFCHLTEQGRRVLRHLTRDPSNPDGYLAHLSAVANLDPVSKSYVLEAIDTYNSGNYKAAAVMIGAASESIILELRSTLVNKMRQLGQSPLTNLADWRIKRVIDTIKNNIDSKRAIMPNVLFENYQAYWAAFTQQIRASRNEVGHPTSINPITEETVHASLLIFPELAKLSTDLSSWIVSNYN